MGSSTVAVVATSRRAGSERKTSAARGFRTDVQALRAFAILAVVINHLWPGAMPGGYIGVDIFFVISGFLISSHILREIESEGRLRLGTFYARRIRRLLPAAVLVLVVTTIAVFLFLPYSRWADNGWQIIGSGTYVENWILAGLSVDYSAHNAAASAVQHYWSLSVEEQFYLFWPLLLVFAIRGGGRRRSVPAGRRRALGAILIVGALSFALSVLYTASAPEQAYFVTFTRVWQFAIGAAVALIVTRIAVPARLRTAVALPAYVALITALFWFGPDTAYPGWAALLPTVATAMVIFVGHSGPVPLVQQVTDLRPIQWVGDISYSLYLWHWPVLVILPFIVRAPVEGVAKLLPLAISLVLAWFTYRLVERPFQKASFWASSVRASMRGAVVLMLIAAFAGTALVNAQQTKEQQTADIVVIPEEVPCAGPAALLGEGDCDPSVPVIDPVIRDSDVYYALAPECGDYDERLATDDRKTTRLCDFSEGAPVATDVWLVGDSHAEQWQAPIFEIARENRWRLTISTFAGCPVAQVSFRGFREGWGEPENRRCSDWANRVEDAIVEAAPAVIFTTMSTRLERVDDGTGRSEREQYLEGLDKTWTRWNEAGSQIVAIADVPLNGDIRDADCLLLSFENPASCARSRSEALPPDPLVEAAARLNGVTLVDLSGAFCTEQECFAAVGGIPVYSDADHLSRTYAAALTPWFREQMSPALAVP